MTFLKNNYRNREQSCKCQGQREVGTVEKGNMKPLVRCLSWWEHHPITKRLRVQSPVIAHT